MQRLNDRHCACSCVLMGYAALRVSNPLYETNNDHVGWVRFAKANRNPSNRIYGLNLGFS